MDLAPAYFNVGWAGPSSDNTLDASERAMRREAEILPASAKGLAFVRTIEAQCRTSLSLLLRCDADSLVLTHGTLDGVHLVLNSFRWNLGDRVCISALEHRSVIDACLDACRRHDLSLDFVPISPSFTPDDVAMAFRQCLSPQTKLVVLSHVLYSTGFVMPVKEIADEAHSHGSAVLVDGAQAVGHIDVDLQGDWSDFYAVSGQKWLCGPSGAGALYVSPGGARREGFSSSPPERWWRSHRRTAGHCVGLIAGFDAAVRARLCSGPACSLSHILSMVSALRDGALSLGLQVVGTHGKFPSCILALSLDRYDPAQLSRRLAEDHDVIVRYIREISAVRFCLAHHNSIGDVSRALFGLSIIVSSA